MLVAASAAPRISLQKSAAHASSHSSAAARHSGQYRTATNRARFERPKLPARSCEAIAVQLFGKRRIFVRSKARSSSVRRTSGASSRKRAQPCTSQMVAIRSGQRSGSVKSTFVSVPADWKVKNRAKRLKFGSKAVFIGMRIDSPILPMFSALRNQPSVGGDSRSLIRP